MEELMRELSRTDVFDDPRSWLAPPLSQHLEAKNEPPKPDEDLKANEEPKKGVSFGATFTGQCDHSPEKKFDVPTNDTTILALIQGVNSSLPGDLEEALRKWMWTAKSIALQSNKNLQHSVKVYISSVTTLVSIAEKHIAEPETCLRCVQILMYLSWSPVSSFCVLNCNGPVVVQRLTDILLKNGASEAVQIDGIQCAANLVSGCSLPVEPGIKKRIGDECERLVGVALGGLHRCQTALVLMSVCECITAIIDHFPHLGDEIVNDGGVLHFILDPFKLFYSHSLAARASLKLFSRLLRDTPQCIEFCSDEGLDYTLRIFEQSIIGDSENLALCLSLLDSDPLIQSGRSDMGQIVGFCVKILKSRYRFLTSPEGPHLEDIPILTSISGILRRAALLSPVIKGQLNRAKVHQYFNIIKRELQVAGYRAVKRKPQGSTVTSHNSCGDARGGERVEPEEGVIEDENSEEEHRASSGEGSGTEDCDDQDDSGLGELSDAVEKFLDTLVIDKWKQMEESYKKHGVQRLQQSQSLSMGS